MSYAKFSYLGLTPGMKQGAERGIIPRAVEDVFSHIETDSEPTRCTGSLAVKPPSPLG